MSDPFRENGGSSGVGPAGKKPVMSIEERLRLMREAGADLSEIDSGEDFGGFAIIGGSHPPDRESALARKVASAFCQSLGASEGAKPCPWFNIGGANAEVHGENYPIFVWLLGLGKLNVEAG